VAELKNSDGRRLAGLRNSEGSRVAELKNSEGRMLTGLRNAEGSRVAELKNSERCRLAGLQNSDTQIYRKNGSVGNLALDEKNSPPLIGPIDSLSLT
jgi:hypothetical protein